MSLSPSPGFDWRKVRWDLADAPVRHDCSYCGAEIGEGSVPLRFWDAASNSCVFCDDCAAQWWGLEPLPWQEEDEP